MLIEQAWQNRYMQGEVAVRVTRTNGKRPYYDIKIGGDETMDLRECHVRDLFEILYNMAKNGDVITWQNVK